MEIDAILNISHDQEFILKFKDQLDNFSNLVKNVKFTPRQTFDQKQKFYHIFISTNLEYLQE